MSWSSFVQGSTPAASGSGFVTLRPVIAHWGPGGAVAAAGTRQAAQDAYQRGQVEEAIRLLAGQMSNGPDAATLEDFLFLGLLLNAGARCPEAIACLRDGLARFPDAAPLHENLGVLLLLAGEDAEAVAASERALALGSDSPNVLDCLADASARLGRLDDAVRHGQAALLAKDRKFGARPRLVAVPDGPPPPFNPANPAENVIAYGLWGDDDRYKVPLLESARILPHLFPGWSMRVYHDVSVDPAYLALLRERGVALWPMQLPAGQPPHRRLLWRFEVAADPTVRRFLCRDADSLLTVKERVAIDAWLASAYHFHAMRDWYTHTDLLLAGMWGGVGGILPPVATLLSAYQAWRVEHDHVDQDLLSETVWPILRGHVLIHDSVFAPCLGSVPFPPYGALPAGMHIGQNAFLHFHRAR